jgi:hypothetical protein
LDLYKIIIACWASRKDAQRQPTPKFSANLHPSLAPTYNHVQRQPTTMFSVNKPCSEGIVMPVNENDYHNQVKEKVLKKIAGYENQNLNLSQVCNLALKEYDNTFALFRDKTRANEKNKIKKILKEINALARTTHILNREQFLDYQSQLLSVFDGQKRGLLGRSKLFDCVTAALSIYEKKIRWSALRTDAREEDKNHVLNNCIQRAAWRLKGELRAEKIKLGISDKIHQQKIECIDLSVSCLRDYSTFTTQTITKDSLVTKLNQGIHSEHAEAKEHLFNISPLFSSYLNEELQQYHTGEAFSVPKEELMEITIIEIPIIDKTTKTFFVTKWSPENFDPEKIIIAVGGHNNTDIWRNYAAEKIKEDYTVYAYDQKVFSDSEFAKIQSEDENLRIFADFIQTNPTGVIQKNPTRNPADTNTKALLRFAGYDNGIDILPSYSNDTKPIEQSIEAIFESSNALANVRGHHDPVLMIYSHLENKFHKSISEIDKSEAVKKMVALARQDPSQRVAKKILATRDTYSGVHHFLTLDQYNSIKDLKSEGELFYLQLSQSKETLREQVDKLWNKLLTLASPVSQQAFLSDMKQASLQKSFSTTEIFQHLFSKALELNSTSFSEINYPRFIANASVEIATSLMKQITDPAKRVEVISVLRSEYRIKLVEQGVITQEDLKKYTEWCENKKLEVINSCFKNRAIEIVDDYLHQNINKAKRDFYEELLKNIKKTDHIFTLLDKSFKEVASDAVLRNAIFHKGLGDKINSRAAKCMFDLMSLITIESLDGSAKESFVGMGTRPAMIQQWRFDKLVEKISNVNSLSRFLSEKDHESLLIVQRNLKEAEHLKTIVSTAAKKVLANPDSGVGVGAATPIPAAKLTTTSSQEVEAEYQKIIIEKAFEVAHDYFGLSLEEQKKFNAVFFDLQGRVLVDVELSDEELKEMKNRFGESITKKIHCNLDIIDHPALLNKFKEWIFLDAKNDEEKNILNRALDELLKHEGRGSVILLQQEMQLFFDKQLRSLEATVLIPQAITKDVKTRVNQLVQKEFREILLSCYQKARRWSGEFDRKKFLNLVIEHLNTARETCAKAGLDFLITTITRPQNGISIDGLKQNEKKQIQNFIDLSAIDNDRLYTSNADKRSTRISVAKQIQIHHCHSEVQKVESPGEGKPTEKIITTANKENQILFCAPPFFHANQRWKGSEPDVILTSDEIMDEVKKQRGGSDAPLFFHLSTSLLRDIDPDEVRSRDKETTRGIFRGMHLRNSLAVRRLQQFVFVINIPVNNQGHALREDAFELFSPTIKEANLLVEMGILANLYDRMNDIHSTEQKACIKKHYDKVIEQYRKFLPAQQNSLFIETAAGKKTQDLLKEFRWTLEWKRKCEQKTVVAIPQDIRAIATNALVRLLVEGNHHEMEHGMLCQVLSIFSARTVLVDGKSANRENQAIMGRVEVLTSISLRRQQGNALTKQEEQLVETLYDFSHLCSPFGGPAEKQKAARELMGSIDRIYRQKSQQGISVVDLNDTSDDSKSILTDTRVFGEALARVEKAQRIQESSSCFARFWSRGQDATPPVQPQPTVAPSPQTFHP